MVEMYGSDMDRAYIGAPWAFMRRRMQIDTPTLSKISVLKAWIPEGTSALVVKFKNRTDVNLVNRFKKNLDPEAKVFDVVPPCCEDIERYLQKKAYLLREPGPNLLKCKTRVCWAGYRRVLMSKPASNTKSTFQKIIFYFFLFSDFETIFSYTN